MSNAYGTLILLDSSPASGYTEPITLAEAQTFLGVPVLSPIDSASDALIEAMITGAREQAELNYGRDLVRKYWRLAHDAFWTTEIPLRAPLVSVQVVKYKDSDGVETTLVENTDYIVDASKEPGLIMPPYGESWPSFTAWPTSAVTIEFTSGYDASAHFWSDAGKRIRNGMLLLISAWFNNRLPFEIGASAIQEYLFAVTASFSGGALRPVK